MKKIGLIIPAYNSEKYIKNCLNSILTQSFCDAQIIIVNDCSTDGTYAIIDAYKPIFLLRGFDYIVINLEKNVGQAACFNNALSKLDAELFMWLDSDDFLYMDCFETKVNFMNENKDIDLCICRADLYKWPDIKNKVHTFSREFIESDYFTDVLKRKNVLWCPGSICVRTKFLLDRIKTKKIYESRQGQNIQLMLPILYKARYRFISKSLYGVVEHFDSHSRNVRGTKELISREHDLYTTYVYTINALDISKKEKRKYRVTAKKGMYLSIFNICISKRLFLRAFWYFVFLSKEDKNGIVARIKRKIR